MHARNGPVWQAARYVEGGKRQNCKSPFTWEVGTTVGKHAMSVGRWGSPPKRLFLIVCMVAGVP